MIARLVQNGAKLRHQRRESSEDSDQTRKHSQKVNRGFKFMEKLDQTCIGSRRESVSWMTRTKA